MDKTHLIAIVAAIAVSFVILFWLSYKQESQLREYRVRQSKMELRVLALEQNQEMMAVAHRISSCGSSTQHTIDETIKGEKEEKKEISDDMKKEIEFIERELETMGRILEDEPINVSVVKLVNKYSDNTFIEVDKIANIEKEELDEETETDEDDSVKNSNTKVADDDSDNDMENEDVCSSEMEMLIQTNQGNFEDDEETQSSRVIVAETESTLNSQVSSSKMTHVEGEIEAWMNQYKVNELKDLCRKEGLSQTGLKRELIDRLMQKGVAFHPPSESHHN
jgi:predicted DNA-binding transcriptional regulator AlpA